MPRCCKYTYDNGHCITCGTQTDRGMTMEAKDPLYEDALYLAISQRVITILKLQREFLIGYNRAARMFERMENEGIAHPYDGTGLPRPVNIKLAEAAINNFEKERPQCN